MSLRFNADTGLIIVPSKLWGPRGDTIVQLALDTGATGSVVNSDVVVLLGYDPAVARARVRMITGSGVEYVSRLTVEKIEALGQLRQSFPILCHTLPPSAPVDGVLGLDFLRGWRLVVDFRTGLVALE